MNDIEKVKFGDQIFDLVANGVKLTECGGSIIFRRGNVAFDSVDENLKKNGSIVQIGISGEEDWSRSDLVYAGRLTKQANYEVSTGVREDVMIAEFRTPDTREMLKDVTAQVAYITMMTGIEMEVFE